MGNEKGTHLLVTKRVDGARTYPSGEDVGQKAASTLRKGQKRWKNWGKGTGIPRTKGCSELTGFEPTSECQFSQGGRIKFNVVVNVSQS